MPAALIPIVLQAMFQYGIPAARDLVTFLHKPNPLLQDWMDMFDKIEDNAKIFLKETANLVPVPSPLSLPNSQ